MLHCSTGPFLVFVMIMLYRCYIVQLAPFSSLSTHNNTVGFEAQIAINFSEHLVVPTPFSVLDHSGVSMLPSVYGAAESAWR